jgi:hypothetical protein
MVARLCDLGCAFAARLEIDQLIPFVVAKCREVLDAEGASVLLLDQERNELYFPYISEENPEVAKRLASLRFSAELGIAASALKTCATLRIEDAQTDPRFYHGIPGDSDRRRSRRDSRNLGHPHAYRLRGKNRAPASSRPRWSAASKWIANAEGAGTQDRGSDTLNYPTWTPSARSNCSAATMQHAVRAYGAAVIAPRRSCVISTTRAVRCVNSKSATTMRS